MSDHCDKPTWSLLRFVIALGEGGAHAVGPIIFLSTFRCVRKAVAKIDYKWDKTFTSARTSIHNNMSPRSDIIKFRQKCILGELRPKKKLTNLTNIKKPKTCDFFGGTRWRSWLRHCATSRVRFQMVFLNIFH
jgi:hypothetical protein